MTKQKLSRFFTSLLEQKLNRSVYTWCLQAITNSELEEVSDNDSQNLIKAFSYLSYARLSKSEEGYLMDIISKIFIEETSFEFYERYAGSAGDYVVEIQVGQDYTGSLLVARLDETNQLLSPDDNAGTADASQTIPIDNLTFENTSNVLHKVRIQLESPLGQASQVLSDFFICLKQRDIDAN